MLRRIVLLLPLVLLLAACSSEPEPPQKPAVIARGDYSYTMAYLRWLIEKEMDANEITGLSIALVDDQRVVWSSGFGYADEEKGVAATAQTPYRMGSIAKVLTASAAMQLAEQGKIELDAPLAKALPGFSIKSRYPDSGPITPRNIMAHHSGLPSNYLYGMVSSKPKYFTTLVDDIRNEYVAYPPDTIFSYSNLAVTLLGAAIEQRSGLPYGNYMAKSFFEPLGMRASYFSAEPDLQGYNEGEPAVPLPLRDLPSGGLVSSVEDLSQFMKMVFADGRVGDIQIISRQSLAEMFRPQYAGLPLDLDKQMGLGWMLGGFDVQNGGVVAGHGGSLLDFHSTMVILPEHRLGVVVASNSTSGRGVVGQVAEAALQLALEAKTGITQPEKKPLSNTTRELSEADAAHYSGYFDTMVGVVKIDNNAGKLDADALGHTFRLVPRDDGTFGLRYKLFGLIPVSVAAFDKISLAMEHVADHDVLVGKIGSDTMLFGEKLRKPAELGTLLDYVGKYEIVNRWEGGPVPENLEIREEDGMVIAECTFDQMPDFVLRVAVEPVSANEAKIAGVGPGRGETMYLAQVNGEKRIHFLGLDIRKLN
jgi:CubicO group peptidase (beta-lactamase class C family)